MPVMAPVEVPKTKSLARKRRVEPVEVALLALSKERRLAVPPEEVATSSLVKADDVPIETFLLASSTKPFPATVSSEEKRLVEEAVVEKRLVVVALVKMPVVEKKLVEVEKVVVELPWTMRLPEMRPLPLTERACEGPVVPIPKKPKPFKRKPSVKVPLWRVEKVREEEAVR